MCVQMHMHMYYIHTKVKAEFLDHWGRVSRWSQSSPIQASLDSQLTRACLGSSSLLGLKVTVMPPGHWVGSRDPEYKVRQALYPLSHLPRPSKVCFEISVPEIFCVSQPACSVAKWFFCHPSQRPPKEWLAEHGCCRRKLWYCVLSTSYSIHCSIWLLCVSQLRCGTASCGLWQSLLWQQGTRIYFLTVRCLWSLKNDS